MTKKHVIVDTGPLVAFINRHDTFHRWATAQFSLLLPPLLTCEAVLSESCFLLRHYAYGQKSVLELVTRGLLRLPLEFEKEAGAIRELLKRYENIPMSLADGCLVRISELIPDSVVCTLDADFRIYRRNKRNTIPLIFPEP